MVLSYDEVISYLNLSAANSVYAYTKFNKLKTFLSLEISKPKSEFLNSELHIDYTQHEHDHLNVAETKLKIALFSLYTVYNRKY